MKMNHALVILTGALLLGGCASITTGQGAATDAGKKAAPAPKTEQVKKTGTAGKTQKAAKAEAVDPAALQALAGRMADAMLASPVIDEITAQGTPVLFVDNIRNQSSGKVDTNAITASLRTRLQGAGKFSFVDANKVAAALQQLEYQQSGAADPAAMVRLGKQTGARYMVYGSFARSHGQEYQMNMTLMDLRSGELLWSDKQKSRVPGAG